MKSHALIAIVLFVLVYLTSLGARPLVAPDETRYAEVPREMLASGDWVTPHLAGFRYFEKPPLGYWLNAVSIWAFGLNNFAVRLPSALSTGLAAVFVFILLRKFGGKDIPAVAGAMMYLVCLEVFVVGTLNVLDALFTMILTGTLTWFFLAAGGGMACSARRWLLALCGVFCGLVFLTKGFLAFLVPLLVVVPYMLWERRFRDLLRMAWLPLLTAVVTALPWSLAIHLREPDFWRYFFWVEHIHRFSSPQAQHARALWFFLPVIAGGALPWTPLVGCIVSGLRRGGLQSPLIRFSLCWLIVPFALFSASRGKLATYILPCYPPLAILAAIGLARCLSADDKALHRATRISVTILLVLAAALPLLQLLPVVPVKPYAPGETFRWALLAVLLVGYALALAASMRTTSCDIKLVLSCAGLAVLLAGVPYILPQQVLYGKAPGSLLADLASRVGPNATLAADGHLAPAVCWYLQRTDVSVVGPAGELAYGASYPDSQHRLLSPEQLRLLAADATPSAPLIIVASREHYTEYSQCLPRPSLLRMEEGFVWAEYGTSSGQAVFHSPEASTTTAP
jgi:4-amino-4-deoxy-L-arabinose transferase